MKKIPTVSRRIHPLLAGAAVSLTLLSLMGTAAFAGWLPSSKAAAARSPAQQQARATPVRLSKDAATLASSTPAEAQEPQREAVGPQ
jgi:hypothetical protein